MTTFTMQDLTTTQEEEQNMDQIQALTEKQMEQMEQLQQHELAHQIVQGASGFQYTPMDTSPQAQELSNLFVNLTATMQAIVKLCVESHTKAQPIADKSLQETVDTVLQSAEWFEETVEEKVETLIDDMDHTYEIESAVESWFSNSFSLDDHVDITAEVESKVEDIAEDLLRDMVEEKLRNVRITFD